MKRIATLAPEVRRDLFTNTAEKMGMTIAIIEKDFWVCWTLDYLFHRCPWKKHLAFLKFKLVLRHQTKVLLIGIILPFRV